MPLIMDIAEVSAAPLEFGDPTATFPDPRIGLTLAGPLSLRFGAAHKNQVRLALVGPSDMLNLARTWFDRTQRALPPAQPDKPMYVAYPGFESAFKSQLVLSQSWQLDIGEDLAYALVKHGRERFEAVLDVYSQAVGTLTRKHRVDVVVCCLPPEVIDTCWTVSRSLTPKERARIARRKRAADSAQMSFADWAEPEEADEDLLQRDFRRALKARTMAFNVPIQIATTALFLDEAANQDPATRAWNSSVALFYKAGGLPWRVRFEGPDTCFIGISFHFVKTSRGSLGYSSLAQAFSAEGDGFVLRGDALLPVPEQGKRTLHLDSSQADELARRVLEEYVDRTGRSPNRIVLHKTTRFDPAEREGFGLAFRQIPLIEYVSIIPSDLRLVQRSAYPPKRGTLFRINNSATYLFVTGFIPEWNTYPGVHVPVPLRIWTDRRSDILRIATEVLALGRMNWNTAFDTTGAPITLRFARQVGGIMREIRPPLEPHPSYRFYM